MQLRLSGDSIPTSSIHWIISDRQTGLLQLLWAPILHRQLATKRTARYFCSISLATHYWLNLSLFDSCSSTILQSTFICFSCFKWPLVISPTLRELDKPLIDVLVSPDDIGFCVVFKRSIRLLPECCPSVLIRTRMADDDRNVRTWNRCPPDNNPSLVLILPSRQPVPSQRLKNGRESRRGLVGGDPVSHLTLGPFFFSSSLFSSSSIASSVIRPATGGPAQMLSSFFPPPFFLSSSYQ